MKTSLAIKLAGSQTKLAAVLGITRQAVGQWVKRKTIPDLQEYRLRERKPEWFKEFAGRSK